MGQGVPLRKYTLMIPVLLFFAVSLGCTRLPPAQSDTKKVWLSRSQTLTVLTDDLDQTSLFHALERSLAYLQRLPAERQLPFGDRQITVANLQDTLLTFQKLLQTTPQPQDLTKAISKQFEIVQASGREGRGDVLFTGYYEMVLPGSLSPTAEYKYPLYARPPDLLDVSLDRFDQRYQGERLTARYFQGQVLPYLSRREIDVEGKLQGRGLELLWLNDPVDRFFLHIQGSGQIILPNQQVRWVNYAASNGHPYRSIGKLLIDEGRIPPDGLSLQSLRRYFRDYPEEQARVLSHNPRYIFFREVERGPRGALGFILVPGRSVATDPKLFPPAGLAFIRTQKPVLGAQGEVIAWVPCIRFVLNHDTGSAITGPGRVDMFWGSGIEAEKGAGYMKQEGQLFFLLKRPVQEARRTSS